MKQTDILDALRKRKKSIRKSIAAYIAAYGTMTVVIIVGFVVAYQFVGPPPPKTLTIATGSNQGAYYHFAQKYAVELKKHGIELEILATCGSADNLHILQSKEAKVDLAFVQGGTGNDEKGLFSLGSIYYEPLWIFYRPDARIRYLSELKGRKVAWGAVSSGTRAISTLLAELNGIVPEEDGVSTLSGKDAVKALKNGEVDAACIVGSPEAPLIKSLFRDPGVRLLNVKRADAYTRRFPFLSKVVIPEGVIDFEKNIPNEDLLLVSPTANLVVRREIHPALVDLILQAAAEVHGKGGLFEGQGEFPAPKSLQYELSPDAARYYKYGPPFLQRYMPFWIATLIDRLKVLLLPLLVLLVPLFKIVPPAFRWRIRRSIIRWYKELQALDMALDEADAAEHLDEYRSIITRLRKEVTQIQVPLDYVDQLYNLRLHINLIRNKLAETAKNTGTD